MTVSFEDPETGAPARQVVKGMVWSQKHGETAFTVPMFAAFMRRQMPQLEKHVPQRRSGKREAHEPSPPKA
jgi:hypothetical protein